MRQVVLSCVHPRTPLRAPDAGSPCFARGAPSHGRRAAGHASERARLKSRLSDESEISRREPDRRFMRRREPPFHMKMERRGQSTPRRSILVRPGRVPGTSLDLSLAASRQPMSRSAGSPIPADPQKLLVAGCRSSAGCSDGTSATEDDALKLLAPFTCAVASSRSQATTASTPTLGDWPASLRPGPANNLDRDGSSRADLLPTR